MLLFFQPSFSQEKADSFQQLPYREYMIGIAGAANLYNGAEYEGSYPLVLGTPFWNNNSFQKGQLCYEGILYNDIPLAYDLVRDEVVTKSFQQMSMCLTKAKLNYFVLDGHIFVHLSPDTTNKYAPPDDIYDRLCNGNICLYAKRVKTVVRSLHAEAQDSFAERASYFLYKGNAYYTIVTERDLLNAFQNEKELLKLFWKSGDMNFKKNPEPFILQTITYWSQLKK